MAVEITDWHKKLAHQNYDHVQKLLTQKRIKERWISSTCKDCLVDK